MIRPLPYLQCSVCCRVDASLDGEGEWLRGRGLESEGLLSVLERLKL